MDWQYVLENFHFASGLWIVLLPCLLMLADVVTGFTNAWVKNEIESAKMRSGLAKKVGELFAILIAELFTVAMQLPQYITDAISIYICFMELISNIENIKKLGVPIPGDIENKIDHLKDEVKPKDENDEDEDTDKE